jgi:hypothetical protein
VKLRSLGFSHGGQVHRPDRSGTIKISHTTFVNAADGERLTYTRSTRVPASASDEDKARAFGEAARLSFLAALKGKHE